MANRKRSVITIATINTAGYLNGKKMTNTFVWKVWMIDERVPEWLNEQLEDHGLLKPQESEI